MSRRKILPALAAAVLPLGLITLGAAPASADYVPAPYSGNASGNILSTQLTAAPGLVSLVPGLQATVSATLAHSAADADSSGSVKTSADSANLDGQVAGLTVDLASAHSEQPAGPATDDYATVALAAAPVANLGVITGTTAANWTGADSCVADGTPLSTSTTSLAATTLLPLSALPVVGDLTGAQVGAAQTTAETALVANGGAGDSRNVVSSATASVANLSLINDLVKVSVEGDASLVSTATGTAGTTNTVYTPPTVSVTVGDGAAQALVPGGSITANVTILPDTGLGAVTATVTLSMAEANIVNSGLTTSGSVSAVLSADIQVEATGIVAAVTGSPMLSTSLDLLPLNSTATAPAGGVQCSLPAPVITSPANGDWTTSTPTITGTGLPGATVHVVIDGTEVGTATVADDGTWSFPVADALAPGQHDVVATQTLDGTTSGQSNNPTFNVAEAPVITAPEDGSTTSDNTPPITGTGQPGATVEVIVDGDSLGTVTVADDGTWSLTPTTPLAAGDHTVDAKQTDAGGNVLSATQVTFTVALDAPVITAPEDGSSTSDTTPTIEGTGTPGATVTVVIDGDEVGTAVVGDDGTWTLELTDELACGPHTVTATQDLNGLVSDASAPVDFTITCATPTPNNGGPTPTPQESSTLPDTGAPAGLGVAGLLGLALLAGGMFLLRRRHA